MSKSILSRTTFLLFCLLSLSCKKLQDVFIKHHGTSHSECRITKFTSTSNYPQKTGIIYYNTFGNPDSIIFDDVSTGQGDFYLFYDSENRLTDCLDMYRSVGVDTSMNGDEPIENDLKLTNTWLKFIYDNDNRIVGDTTFFDAVLKPGSLKPMDWNGKINDKNFIISNYEYDSKGRIIKVFSYFKSDVDSKSSVKLFNYDNNGNLIVPGRHYDNQVNFLNTHRIWNLLAKDYSKNNPYPAIKYNSKGLPIKFDYSTTEYLRFLFTDMSQSEIKYSCQ